MSSGKGGRARPTGAPSQDWTADAGYTPKSRVLQMKTWLSWTRIEQSHGYVRLLSVVSWLVIVLIVGAVIAAGVGFLSWPIRTGADLLKATRASTTWLRTDATIIAVESRRVSYKGSISYCHHVRYFYEVGGRHYFGTRATFRDSCTKEPGYKWSGGDHAVAWYDPLDPSDATLDPVPPTAAFYTACVVPLTLLAIGAGFLVDARRRRRKTAQASSRGD